MEQENLDLLIDRITYCSKPYFNKALKRMATTNQENCMIICEYISSEVTELNIKQSTREGKIKVLVRLSTFLRTCMEFIDKPLLIAFSICYRMLLLEHILFQTAFICYFDRCTKEIQVVVDLDNIRMSSHVQICS
jgi:hypothetical protein